jgi:hypothetical protein
MKDSISSAAARLLRIYRVDVRAAAPPEREHTRAVRHEVYCVEKRFLEPDALFDAYDDRAILLNAYRGDEPVVEGEIA